MRVPSEPSHDVLIAGAGPVGLFLACELRLAGCSVLVLERAADPGSPQKELPFGRRGLSVPTIEALDRRDLLQPLRDTEAATSSRGSPAWMQHTARRPTGHFAGIQFFDDQVDQAQWPWRLPRSAGNLAVDMATIEAMLTTRAEALGVEIRRGRAVDAVAQDDDGVTVHAGEEMVRARWLVGCDGGRSAVRKAAGIGFTGTAPEFTGYSILATLADPDTLAPGRHYTATGMYMFTPPGTINIADFDGGAFHRTDPITREHVEAVLRRVSGTDVEVTSLELASTWTDRAFQATEYRRGRVLLAGDAAHVHSPLGGQGLNLGLGDAMNLGWKLAATIRGDAPEGLLDSYRPERHPIGARILDWSRAQVALMRPSASSRALEGIVRDLIATGDGATYFAGKVWGVDQRYDLGDGHPLVGRSMPDLTLADGTRLNARLRDGRGLLVDAAAQAPLRALADRYRERIGYVDGVADNPVGVTAALVRPDGIVAWASDGTGGEATQEQTGLEQAAARWFGDAR